MKLFGFGKGKEIPQTQEASKEAQENIVDFSEARSFEDLYAKLREAGVIVDSQGRSRDAEVLIGFIEEILNNSGTGEMIRSEEFSEKAKEEWLDESFKFLTSKNGLRSKAIELTKEKFSK